MVKIIVDTNLLVAGRWRPNSNSDKIIQLCLDGKLKAVYTAQIKDENLHILEKVRAPKGYIDRVLKFYQNSERVKPKKKMTACRDPSDNRYLEAAVEAKADYVVTSDRHLLELEKIEQAEILRPTQLLKRIRSRQETQTKPRR